MSYLEPDPDETNTKGFRQWQDIRLWGGLVGAAFILVSLVAGHLKL